MIIKNGVKEKLYNTNERIVISLDGPAASGKGHIGRELAGRFNLEHLDSGKIYRAFAYLCLKENITESMFEKIIALVNNNQDTLEIIKNIDLTQEDIGQMASKISIIPEVRQLVTKKLKYIIASTHRIIMEGRDISSVVAPGADIKIYITADIKVRAKRRHKQLHQNGKECMIADVLNALIERDDRDINRKNAPLKQTAGSIFIDTSNLMPNEVIDCILEQIK